MQRLFKRLRQSMGRFDRLLVALLCAVPSLAWAVRYEEADPGGSSMSVDQWQIALTLFYGAMAVWQVFGRSPQSRKERLAWALPLAAMTVLAWFFPTVALVISWCALLAALVAASWPGSSR